MSTWSDIYKKQLKAAGSLETFVQNKLAYKKRLIDIIEKYAANGKRLLEAGCGSGITSIFLSQQGYSATGIDSDPDMIQLASSFAAQLKNTARFHTDDLKTLETIHERYDVIFSNGVMEHFSDSEIITIVNRHLSTGDHVIISVPSDYFSDEQRIHGDERFLSTMKWRSILSHTQGTIIEEFSFDSDKEPSPDHPQFIGFVLRAA